MKQCHKCGAEWADDKKQPGPKDFCSKCTAFLHCCKNCKFYAPGRHNQCQIPNTEWVGDRGGHNFCDEFEFLDSNRETKPVPKKDAHHDALDVLFGDVERTSTGREEAKDDFEKLFGDRS